MREIGPLRALANVVLTLALLGVAGFGATLVARRHWQWQETFHARAEFARISGLAVGDKVHIQGMDAGTVAAIEPPRTPGAPVTVLLRIDARLRSLVRSDAVATIGTQGIVGAKIVAITPGQSDAPVLADGGTIRAEAPIELTDLLQDARTALARVESVAATAETGLDEINAIAATIRRGEGTLGRLVRDDEAYERLLALSERGEKAIVALDENLSAVKGLWPLSGYFQDRGFDDIEKVLYRPDATRETRTFPAADLFRPGTAILTDDGRGRLDEFAHWFQKRRWPSTTEVVIAAFANRDADESKARILTTEQAEAVRAYLDEEHKLFSLSWFRKRKSAVVGFGTHVPPAAVVQADNPPASQVEIDLFTPQDSGGG